MKTLLVRSAVFVGLAVSAVGCVDLGHLRLKSGTWRFENRAYLIVPTSEGKLMPAGWTLRDFAPDDVGLDKTKVDAADLVFAHDSDDGALSVGGFPGEAADRAKSLDVVFDRLIQQLRLLLAQAARRGLPLMELRPRGTPQPIDVHGGEGLQMEFDVGVANQSEPIKRQWIALSRARSGDSLVLVVYQNSIARFAAGLPDSVALMDRLRVDEPPVGQ